MASAPSSPRLAAVIGTLLASSAAWAQAASVLKDVRYVSSKDFTRVSLETSAETKFRAEPLENPDRVFVDLYDVRPNKEFKGLAYTVPVEDGVVKKIRVALNQKGVTRVVVDLTEATEFKTTQLKAPSRVVLEFRRAGRLPAPAKAQSKRYVPPPERAAPSAPWLKIDLANLPRVTARSRVPELPAWAKKAEGLPAPNRQEPAAEVAAKPAQPNRRGSYPLTRALGLKLNRVVLDAGHGGRDTGSVTKGGLAEKELALDVTLRLGKLIEERMGTEVIYTRTDDTFVALARRTEIANERKADLFLSIHANSSNYRGIVGTETYYLSFTKSQVDMEVAARENASSDKSIHELSDLVKRVMMNEKLDESREFAGRVQSSSFALASQTYGGVRNRGVKKAPFIVLIGATMPSVLTEIGFMSNPREETLLKRADHRQRIAEALYKGIAQYERTLSHFAWERPGGPEGQRVAAARKLGEGQ